MHPTLIKLGPLVIRSYGTLVAIGFLVGTWFGLRLARKRGISADLMLDLVTLTLVSAVVGARLLFVAINWEDFSSNWLAIFKVWDGGLVFYGGFILAFVVAVLYVKKCKANVWETADIFGPGIALATSIGRWGCFCAGCCWGKPTNAWWGITFTNPQAITPFLYKKLHPTQIYHSLANFLIFLFLWKIFGRKKFNGEVFCLYIILYAAGRFIIEFFRGDNPEILFHLHISQLIALILIPIAIAMLWKLSRHFRQT